MDEGDRQLQFCYEIGKLKHLDRAGWVIQGRDINKPETVSGHMYRMAVIAMTLTDDYIDEEGNPVKFDRNKVAVQALVHDMAECIVGDITPFDGISEEEKHKREKSAMDYLTNLLKPQASQYINDLYEEYEKRETIESLIVKELDRFDVMVQGFEYEKSEYYNNNRRIAKFQEFFDNAKDKIKHPQLVKMTESLNKQREQHWKIVNHDNLIPNGDI